MISPASRSCASRTVFLCALCIAAVGTWMLHSSSVQAATCGNSVVESGEGCDLGTSQNNAEMFGCRKTCQVWTEMGFHCQTVPQEWTGTPISKCYRCGNGKVDPDEQCDLGNNLGTDAGSGCSYQCTINSQWTCTDKNYSIQSCKKIQCGNSIIDAGEECDLGVQNTIPGRGCTSTCTISPGATCPKAMLGGFMATTSCTVPIVPICGNWIVETGEECDTGPNVGSRLGCTGNCQVQPAWTCPKVTASNGSIRTPTCTMPTCGNGKIDPEEDCDDGNTNAVDGCNTCTFNPGGGWKCPTPMRAGLLSSICSKCGDGKIAGDEDCEDGNAVGGDGCSNQCKTELGWFCDRPSTANPLSHCWKPVCGNHVVEGYEQCDNGASNGLGSCSKTCQSVNTGSSSSCSSIPVVCVVAPCPPVMHCTANPVCGNAIIETGEECDAGGSNGINGNSCSSNCKLAKGYECGYFNAPTQGSPAQYSCRNKCGNSKVDTGEECDRTALASYGKPCSPLCHSLECKAGETVDDNCENGKLDPGEECDDGNDTCGDGCSYSCKQEEGFECIAATGATFCTERGYVGLDFHRSGPLMVSDTSYDAAYMKPGSFAGERMSDSFPLSIEVTNNDIVTADGIVATFTSYLPKSGFNCGWLDGSRKSTTTVDVGSLAPGESREVTAPLCFIPACNQQYDFEWGAELTSSNLVPWNNGQHNFHMIISCPSGNNSSTKVIVPKDRTSTSVCGNGVIEGNEKCDMGSSNSILSGCTDKCVVNAGWTCKKVKKGFTTTYTSECTKNGVCGNSQLESGEKCDDGNTVSGDGCSARCSIENGYTCLGYSCSKNCGNAILDKGEKCDYGAARNDGSLGCTSTCKVQSGWKCDATGGCSKCGNGKIEGGEKCDDGNTAGRSAKNKDPKKWDGCSSTCTVDPDWQCVIMAYSNGASVCTKQK